MGVNHLIVISDGDPHWVTCRCGFAFVGGFARMADAVVAGELHLRAIQSVRPMVDAFTSAQ